MCSSYWTIEDDLICPACHEKGMWDIQTHEYGEIGSCVNTYPVGAAPDELKGVQEARINEGVSCPECGIWFDATIIVSDGVILDVQLKEQDNSLPGI